MPGPRPSRPRRRLNRAAFDQTPGAGAQAPVAQLERRGRCTAASRGTWYLDLLGTRRPASTGPSGPDAQGNWCRHLRAWWRPALARVAKGMLRTRHAPDEQRIARLLLGLLAGRRRARRRLRTGNFSRGFARTVGPGGANVVVGRSDVMPDRCSARPCPTRARAGWMTGVAYVHARQRVGGDLLPSCGRCRGPSDAVVAEDFARPCT